MHKGNAVRIEKTERAGHEESKVFIDNVEVRAESVAVEWPGDGYGPIVTLRIVPGSFEATIDRST